MRLRTPSAGTPIALSDLVGSLVSGEHCEAFREDLGDFLGAPHCALCGSGTSAFYATLLALSKRSDATEVVLPAYTAPSLVLPVLEAGLRPVLAETSVHTLNADADSLLSRCGPRTLAVVPVHMYGLATDVACLRDGLPSETWIVEDACSSLGTCVGGEQTGTTGHIGFYSFNRGKNLTTLTGGAISSRDEELIGAVNEQMTSFRKPGRVERVEKVAMSAALALAVRPSVYTALYPLIERHKYNGLHTDFDACGYTPFRAALGRRILSRFDDICEARRTNAGLARRNLSDVDGVALPTVQAGSDPVMNQFPILLPNRQARDLVHARILETGLETTRLYPDPVHLIYDTIWDGFGPDPYPQATQISERLILLPVHPLVSRVVLQNALGILVDVMSGMKTPEEALTP